MTIGDFLDHSLRGDTVSFCIDNVQWYKDEDAIPSELHYIEMDNWYVDYDETCGNCIMHIYTAGLLNADDIDKIMTGAFSLQQVALMIEAGTDIYDIVDNIISYNEHAKRIATQNTEIKKAIKGTLVRHYTAELLAAYEQKIVGSLYQIKGGI